MENRKLISEITRIQEMMGIQIITESSFWTKFEKYLLPSIEKLIKSGEKVADRELEQAFVNSLDDAIVDTSNIYSKKLKRKGILTLQDLANLGSKGFTEEEVEGITKLLLTKAVKQIDQNFPGLLQKTIDNTVTASKGYIGVMKTAERTSNKWADGIIPQEEKESAQKLLARLKNSRNNYSKMDELSPELRETTVKQLDDAINSLEQKLNGTFTKAAGETISVTGEQASKLADELSNSFENVEQLYKPDLNTVKSMAEKAGWPKEEINKLIKLMAKDAPKTEEEFVQKTGKYIADNKDRIAEQLRKEGLEKEARELTKMSTAEILAKWGKSYSKFYNSSTAAKATIWVLWLAAIGITGGAYGWYEKISPAINFVLEGGSLKDIFSVFSDKNKENETKPTPQDQNQTKPTEASGPDFISWYEKRYPEDKNKITWLSFTVDGSDNTLITVKGKEQSSGLESEIKFKKQTDGTYKIQE